MGNQQLLLLVLGTIVVAIAVAVGIVEFRAYYTESVGDEIQSTILSWVGDAKAYYVKPTTLGGGGGSFNGYAKNNDTREIGSNLYQIRVTSQAITFSGSSAKAGLLAATLKSGQDGYTILWRGTGSFSKRRRHEASL